MRRLDHSRVKLGASADGEFITDLMEMLKVMSAGIVAKVEEVRAAGEKLIATIC